MHDEEEDVMTSDIETTSPTSYSARARRPQTWNGGTDSLEIAYELGALHAEAMQIMNATNWPLGKVVSICIGTRPIDRRERKSRGIKDKTENVYLEIHAITVFPGLYFTRSGAVYREHLVRGDGPCVLVDFATDELTHRYFYREGLQSIIDRGNKILADFR